MVANKDNETAPAPNRTVVERRSDRDVFVTRSFDAPARNVFAAWSTADLMKRWWVPKSMGMSLVSCEMDVRTGGKYRLEFDFGGPSTVAFFGTYVDVVPNARIVWTNEESEFGAVTTVTFDEKDGKTLLVLHEHYPSKEAFDASVEGTEGGMPEQLAQLEELLATMA
jgi:uncharacterized protein YndB with AHSA1/START domain